MLERDAHGAARIGGALVSDLLDEAGVSTPTYVYDLDAIIAGADALRKAFEGAEHLVAYAVKANTAGPILRALARAGCGADVVSGGELTVALACGLQPDKLLYSGVAKTDAEIDRAIGVGTRGILAIQIESVEEIARVGARGEALGRTARVSLRINPEVAADTHAHVATGHDEAKFGIHRDDLPAAWEEIRRNRRLELVGLSSHIGSQLTRTEEYVAAADVVLEIARARETAAGPLTFVDFGGGFGIDYGSGCSVAAGDFVRAAAGRLAASPLARRMMVIEPGRCLVAAHGILCASVVMAKRSRSGRRWLMIDAGMNDLVRPALYGALHRIEPLGQTPPAPGMEAPRWRVVGPVCESSDDFGWHRFTEPLPDRVVIRDAGAYAYVMASQYNGRALPAEVFVQGGRVAAVHRPPSADAWAEERARIGLDAPR